jgi:rSAM/selenodomain-associated transferase 2
LAATLANIQLALNVEVIVVDGGSQDDTVQIAHSFGAKVLSAPAGRACQMNFGAKAASGDILLFLHADTRLPAKFDAMVAKALFAASKSKFPNKAPVAGAFELRIDAPLLSLRLIEIGVNWRSRWLQMPYGDQAIFLKSQVFHDIGGFPDLPIMEDFELMLRLKRLGRIAIIPEPVLTSGRRWQKLGVLKTTLINQGAIIAYLLHIPPKQIAWWYRQH